GVAVVPSTAAEMAGARLDHHRGAGAALGEQPLHFGLATNRRASLTSERGARHIADAAIGAAIAPGPAKAFVEHLERRARPEFLHGLRIGRGRAPQGRRRAEP